MAVIYHVGQRKSRNGLGAPWSHDPGQLGLEAEFNYPQPQELGDIIRRFALPAALELGSISPPSQRMSTQQLEVITPCVGVTAATTSTAWPIWGPTVSSISPVCPANGAGVSSTNPIRGLIP